MVKFSVYLNRRVFVMIDINVIANFEDQLPKYCFQGCVQQSETVTSKSACMRACVCVCVFVCSKTIKFASFERLL